MEANTTAATLDMRATPSQKNPSGVAWNWILEKLLELSDAKKPLLKEIMSHAPDVKEAQSHQLLEKVAVRFLDEMIVTAPLDMAAVPLIRILTKRDNTQEASSEEIYQTDLGLRVRTEAVLSTIRKISGDGKRDWSRFVSALDQVFPEESEDTRDISQRKELVAYLFPKNQKEVSVTKLLSKYPLKLLQQDVLQLLEQKKARFQLSILDQLAERILSKAPVPSSTEDLRPTDVDSPDTHRCSGHMSILNKRKTHESTRQEASECQEVSMASGQYKGKVKHSRLRTAQNRKEVEKQGEEVLTKDTKTEKAPEEDATHKDGYVASEVEEENRKENAVKRRRVLLNVEVTSESEEDHTSRSARTELTYWPGRESMVATSPGRQKVIQGSSSQIQDIPRRNLGRHIHPDASVEKKGALHRVEFSNEDEDGGSRNVKPCLKRAVEKSNPQVCCNSHPGAVNLFLARNALGTGSITANSLRTHSLFRESPVLTKGASGDLDIGIRLTEEKDRKHVNSLEHRPSKALDVVLSEGDRERLCKQGRSRKKVFVQEAEVRELAGTPSEPKTYTPLKDFTPAVQLSSEENAQRSDDEWQSRKKSLRQAALENCVANSRLMQQTKTPSQEELEMFFNDLRPLRRHKQGIGVQEQENLEHDESSRSDITKIIKHGGDTLFKSRNIDYHEPIKSNKFDIKSGDNETTPTVDGNTFDRLHLKDVQELEKGATQFVSNLLAFFGGAYEEPKKDCNPKSAQDNMEGGHDFSSVEYLEIGNDGHEERCHRCRKFGELLCCDGCPIAMHTSCLEPLGLMLPNDKENWYCPVCCEREAMKLVVEADKIAAEARANFEAFIQQSSKKRRQSEGGTYPHKKARKEHKSVAHGSAPMKMAYKGDSTSSKLRKKTTDVQETCALKSEMKAANMAMLVRKASRPDRWRAIIHQSGSSTDEDLLDHKRQDITVENTGTISSDVLIPVVMILDVGRYVNRPVSSIDREDINTNKDGENTPQHTREGGNPHLLEVFEPKEGNLSTRVGKLKEGHCQGVSGSKVIAERGDSPAEELPLNIPNPEGKDVEVEHVNKGGRPAPGEVEKDKDKNEGDLEEAGGKTLIGSLRNSMLGIPGVQRTPVPWTQDEEDALKEGVQRLSQNGHWVVHKTPIQMAYKADCTSSQLRKEATDVLETYVPKSEMATANVAIVPKSSRPDQLWRAIIHQSSSSSEEDLLDHKQQDIPAENTSTSSSDVLVSVMRIFDVGKYVNRPISSIDREGINTNKDGENPCEERSCESNPQHTPRGRNAHLLEVSEPKEANLSISFGKLKEGHCQGVSVTTERGDSPAGKSPLNNPNPEDEEVEVEHVNKGGRPAPGEVEEDKDKNEGDLEEAGGSTLIGSLRKNMLGGWYRIPGVLRRTPVPWTQDEEDALKEGVQHFSQDGQCGFQWTRILQYGVGRYHHTRTSRDLSDKWRTMIKGCTY